LKLKRGKGKEAESAAEPKRAGLQNKRTPLKDIMVGMIDVVNKNKGLLAGALFVAVMVYLSTSGLVTVVCFLDERRAISLLYSG